MSLVKRPKAKTHSSMDMATTMRMAGEIEDLATDGQVSASEIEDLATDLGVPAAKLYAGLGMTPALALKLEHAVQVVVCTGACQNYGALPCVTRLLEIRQDREEEDLPAFDLVPRHCLNRCENGPVIEIRSADGTAVLVDSSPDLAEAAIDELFA